MVRRLRNDGMLPVSFRVSHDNAGLIVTPDEDQIPPNQAKELTFQFRPVDEQMRNSRIVVSTNCTPDLELFFQGAGGVAKLHLEDFEHLEFGRVLINKMTTRYLRISNIGNAVMPLEKCVLGESSVFERGVSLEDRIDDSDDDELEKGVARSNVGWPPTGYKVLPGCHVDVPIEFTPTSSDLFTSSLLIKTDTQSVRLELSGEGRQALLKFDRTDIEFAECLVGNMYTKELYLMNLGEQSYPVNLRIQDDEYQLMDSLTVTPEQAQLGPRAKRKVVLKFHPQREFPSLQVPLILDTRYSYDTVDVCVSAGTASFTLDTELLDFGAIELGIKSSKQVRMTNVGTLGMKYVIKASRPWSELPFALSRVNGRLAPGVDIILHVTVLAKAVLDFCEELCVETERAGYKYYFTVKGSADASIIDPNEFNNVSFGYCMVGEPQTRKITVANRGGYPLDYTMKANYPLSIKPEKGHVEGHSQQEFVVTWTPTGAYEMKQVIRCATNTGVHEIACRGRGVHPEIVLENSYLDFGVCALTHTYEEEFTVINKVQETLLLDDGGVSFHFLFGPILVVPVSLWLSQRLFEHCSDPYERSSSLYFAHRFVCVVDFRARLLFIGPSPI